MKAEYERERGDKAKIQQDMLKLRAFYDTKLSSVDGKIAGLPPTAAGESVLLIIFVLWRVKIIYIDVQR